MGCGGQLQDKVWAATMEKGGGGEGIAGED